MFKVIIVSKAFLDNFEFILKILTCKVVVGFFDEIYLSFKSKFFYFCITFFKYSNKFAFIFSHLEKINHLLTILIEPIYRFHNLYFINISHIKLYFSSSNFGKFSTRHFWISKFCHTINIPKSHCLLSHLSNSHL